ncbi:nitrate- and nitrite sensing domain-containing protein, partial [Streptomyces sp. T-3]|nr:nitrate- and nitrite sensing domain-containing protein [Streptomyces sp. T-3]
MPARTSRLERLRPKSIRAKVVTLLTLPVVSLMALWGHAAVTTASQVSATEQLKQVNSALVRPITGFTNAVQDERAAALKYRSAPGAGRDGYDAAVLRTDKAVSALRKGVHSSSTDLAALDAALPDRIARLLKSADSLRALRASSQGPAAVLAGYGVPVDRAFSVRSKLAGADRTDHASDTRTVLELGRAREALSRQAAVLGAAQTADAMTAAQYRAFVGDV